MGRAHPLLALCVGACAAGSPAPIAYGSGQSGEPAAPRSSDPAPSHASPDVAPDWADGPGRSLSDYALRPEDVHPYDPARPPAFHRVRENESIYDIAAAYQIPLLALIDQNQLEPPYALSAGRELRLPPPRFHTVARGERFEDVARRYNVDTRSLALLNRMQAPYSVRQGDRIVLPAIARRDEQSAPPPMPAAAPSNQHARFSWPLRGEIVARFGAQPGGARVDGIEIAGAQGAPIMAAADGEVVYAGDDLPSYGTLILVRHDDNFVTAYAYAQRSLVREGQRVRGGERIAELGAHGGERPRLLFQVRQGAAAVDPAPLLGP